MLENEPKIRVGLVQGISEVRSNLHDHWTLSDAHGTRRITDLHLRFRHIMGPSKEERYTVKLAEFLSSGAIGRWLPALRKVAVDSHLTIVDVGRLWSIKGRTWDARTRWIVAGNYGSRADAEEATQEWNRVLEEAFPNDINLFWPQPEPLESAAQPSGAIEVVVGDQLCRSPLFQLEPLSPECVFSVHNITIGKDFHWERLQTLSFRGSITLLGDRYGGITVINELPIESYLESVAFSEATTGASDEYLKAQTVAARSTVLATVSRHHRADPFDLCADDHCQCYYGIDQVDNRVSNLVNATRGLVRVSGQRPADCRYAKICGGVSENYADVWGGESLPYLKSKPCGSGKPKQVSSIEEFLSAAYPSLCNPRCHKYPTTLEHARSLYRWEQQWDADKCSQRIQEVLNPACRIGRLRELRPITRGASGRITRLQVIGSEGSVTVRGELTIRKMLSTTHLPSSLFVVDTEGKGSVIQRITLRGAGWGHGVGMCQLGGMAMARSGSGYDKILDAYYPGTITESLW